MTGLIEQLNALSQPWAERLWAACWQWTVLAAAVGLVAFVLLRRTSPGVRYWLWQILLIKLLVMPFWVVAVPLPAAADEPQADSAAPALPGAAVKPPPPGPLENEPDGTPVPLELSAISEAPAEAPPRLAWHAWLMLAWGGLIVLQTGRVAVQRLRLGRMLSSARDAEGKLAQRVEAVAGKLKLNRTPRAVVHDGEFSPFVCGLRRPVLVLPARVVDSLQPGELDQVLLHELAHVKRRDLLWGWVCEIVRIVYFFHPVVHWVAFRVHLERELACDQQAMAHTGGDASTYARTLVRVVTRPGEPTALHTAAVAARLDGKENP